MEEKDKNTNKAFALNEKETYTFIITLFVLLILFFIVCYNCENIRKFGDYISKFFIAGTIIVAILQQLKTKQWNKKQLGLLQIHKVRKKTSKILKELNDYFKIKGIKPITERKIEDKFTLIEIHKLFGNGIYSPNEGFIMADDGQHIKKLLLEYLGEYEYIATGTNLNIFDEEAIERMLGYNIKRAYFIFEDYIKHLRNTHIKDPSIYKELEILATKLQNEEK